jgi:hypothetical protein
MSGFFHDLNYICPLFGGRCEEIQEALFVRTGALFLEGLENFCVFLAGTRKKKIKS